MAKQIMLSLSAKRCTLTMDGKRGVTLTPSEAGKILGAIAKALPEPPRPA